MSGPILSDSLPIRGLAPIEALRSEWFWSVDADCRYTYFSPSYVSLTGFPPPLGVLVHELVARGHDAELSIGTLPPLERLAESHVLRVASQDVPHDDARTRAGQSLRLSSSWLPQFDAQGGFEGIMGVTRCCLDGGTQASHGRPEAGTSDTAPARNRDGMSSTGGAMPVNVLRTVLDTVPFTITVRDRHGNFVMVNRAFSAFYEVDERDLLGKHVNELRDQLGIAKQATIPDADILYGRIKESDRETYRLNSRGDHRIIRGIRRPYVGENGEIAGIVTVAVDITEQKQAEQEAALYRDKLEALVEERTAQLISAQATLLRQEKLATLGQLTATVSHELRNPLATISQSALQIRRHAADSDTLSIRTLDRIDRSIARCVAIIEQLLSFGQMHRQQRVQRLRLDRWLATVLDAYQWMPGIKHVIELGADVEIVVDSTRIDQAITNLLDNACQAVIGDAAEPASGIVAVKTRVSAGRVEIVVSDSGPGIALENRDLVFEPLFSTRTYGFGLGMSLVKQVALDHGGDVEVGEAEFGGAMLTLRLPLGPGK